MEFESERLYTEIVDIAAHYQKEVPSGRRAWPESIRSRVFALRKSGVRCAEISRRTGLPYYTVLQWKDPSAKFIELSVRAAPERSGTVAVPDLPKLHTVTVPGGNNLSVLLPTGVLIQGLSVEALTRLLPALGVRQ